jgi:hypothetical protein
MELAKIFGDKRNILSSTRVECGETQYRLTKPVPRKGFSNRPNIAPFSYYLNSKDKRTFIIINDVKIRFIDNGNNILDARG